VATRSSGAGSSTASRPDAGGSHGSLLRGTAEQLSSIVQSSNDAIVGKTLDGTIVSWNAGAERMYGWRADEVIGRRISVIVPAGRARELASILERVARGDRVEHLETVRTRKDGSEMDVSVTVSPIRDDAGVIVGASAIARDISERKRVEAALIARDRELERTCALLEQAERLSRTGTWVLELRDPPALFWSNQCYRLLGEDPTTPMTIARFFDLVHPDDVELLNERMGAALSGGAPYEVEHRIRAADGSWCRLHVWAEPEFDDDGTPVRVLGVAQDITARYAAETALRASEERFRLLTENAHDFIFRYELVPEGRFSYASPAAEAVTGYTPEQLYADPSLVGQLVAPEHVEEVARRFADRVREPMDVRVRHRDGTVRWVNQQLSFVQDEHGELVAVEGISRDITRRKLAEERVEHLGFHDALTGLPNRVLLRDRINLTLRRAVRDGGRIVVIAFDLDDFTLLNDRMGPDVGDAVLREVALRLGGALPDTTVARVGSDEFVIVAGVTRDDEALVLVERVHEATRAPISTADGDVTVSGRVGVTVDGPGASASTLLRNADLALSRAKARHGTQVVEFFEPGMRARTDARFALIHDLRDAVGRDEFELRFQPVVSLRDDRIESVEALVRWRHPQRGIVTPGEFVPVAEDTGDILAIGEWVLRRACAQLAEWATDPDPDLARLHMSVNVSVRQLERDDVVARLAEIVWASGAEPTRLTLEMTESVLVEDVERFHDVLTQLRSLGVRIAVDDFGTGYSSLAYLRQLPFDVLKIDQTFVRALAADPLDRAIVESTLTLARALHLSVIAEGVEDVAQLAELRVMGCDAIQGYLMARPLTLAELETWVRDRSR
jgi:PAS domain S-box-containing protein/diguanylate cyclase (GGDEF)-like protein